MKWVLNSEDGDSRIYGGEQWGTEEKLNAGPRFGIHWRSPQCLMAELSPASSPFRLRAGIGKDIREHRTHFHVPVQYLEIAKELVEQRLRVEVIFDRGDNFQPKLFIAAPVLVHEKVHGAISEFNDFSD